MVRHIRSIIRQKWCITLNLKTMRTLVFFASILLTMNSCDKEKEKIVFDQGIEITVLDELGNDLLNPSNQNAYDVDKIKIFYLINGVIEEVYNPNYDNPRNFSISEREGLFRLMLTLNATENDEYPTTYIRWSESDTDTIKCIVKRTDRSVICTKVWYNDSLVWDDLSIERQIQIVK